MSSYYVGQVIYLLVDKKAQVFPVQIVEEIVRKTMEGEEVTYMVKLPNASNDIVNLNELKAEIFTDSQKLKDFMIKNAKDAVTQMINKAIDVGDNLFTKRIKKEPQKVQPVKKEKPSVNELLLDLKTEEKPGSNKPIVSFPVQDPSIIDETIDDTNSVQNLEKPDKIKVDLGNGLVANLNANGVGI